MFTLRSGNYKVGGFLISQEQFEHARDLLLDDVCRKNNLGSIDSLDLDTLATHHMKWGVVFVELLRRKLFRE